MGSGFKRRAAFIAREPVSDATPHYRVLNAFDRNDRDGSGFVSMTVGARPSVSRSQFRPARPSGSAAEDVGWVCRTRYWASSGEPGLLAP